MKTEQIKTLWTLPCKSQEFEEGPQVMLTRRTVTLKYDYEAESGYAWAAIVFNGVHGFQFTRDYSCEPNQIDAYDKVVEVQSSSWVEKLLARRPRSVPTMPVKHYRIYFDNVGCYDVAAEDFQASNE